MKVKTSELTGAALDWAVATASGITKFDPCGVAWVQNPREEHFVMQFQPSTDWSQGGPIIELEKIETRHDGRQSWCTWMNKVGAMHGPTPLIAAMRCFVASKLGDEVEMPDELLP